MATPKLLWIAWDAADWRLLRPLLDSGRMPHLHALMKRGMHGPLHATGPLLSQSLWTSQATGISPLHHGVLGPMTMRPDRSGTWPADRSVCLVPRVWDYAEAAGKKSIVVNFPATHPARPPLLSTAQAELTQLTNLFPLATREDDLADSVWPPSLIATLLPLRLEPVEVDEAILRTFVPTLDQMDRSKHPLVATLAGILAQVITTHAAATALLESRPWDLAAVAYMGIHQSLHTFMAHHSPAANSPYSQVITQMILFHDLMLGRLVQLAGADARILLTSDHGFAVGPDRPAYPAANDHDLQAWHRPEGIALLAGPGISTGAFYGPIATLDIASNLMSLMEIAPPFTMIGRQWSEAFSPPPAVANAPLTMLPTAPREPTHAEQFLHSLGYVAQPDPGADNLQRRLVAERDYYTALHLLDAQRTMEAIDKLEHALKILPQHRHFSVALARGYIASEQIDKLGPLLDSLHRQHPDSPLAALARGKWELAMHHPDAARTCFETVANSPLATPPLLIDAAEGFLRLHEPERAMALLQQARRTLPNSRHLLAALASSALAQNDPHAARGYAIAALDPSKEGPRLPDHYCRLAEACIACGDLSAARDALKQAIALDPHFVSAWRRLSTIHERLGEFTLAHDAALKAHIADTRGGRQRSLIQELDKALQVFARSSRSSD